MLQNAVSLVAAMSTGPQQVGAPGGDGTQNSALRGTGMPILGRWRSTSVVPTEVTRRGTGLSIAGHRNANLRAAFGTSVLSGKVHG